MSKLRDKTYGIITPFDARKKSVRVAYWIMVAVMICVIIVAITPPLWVLISGFKSKVEFFQKPPTILPHEWHPERIPEIWSKYNFLTYYLNSFIVVAGAIICAVVFNGLMAYALTMLKPKGYQVVAALVMWSLMIPATTGLVPLYKNLVGLSLIGNKGFIALWFAYGANAFYVTLYRDFYKSIPYSLIEAARLDGCTDFQIFFHIVVPLSKSINMVIMMYALNAAWSDFLLPYIVLKDDKMFTVMVKLYVAQNSSRGLSMDEMMMCILFAIIPPVILFLIFQKNITQGVASTGIKG